MDRRLPVLLLAVAGCGRIPFEANERPGWLGIAPDAAPGAGGPDGSAGDSPDAGGFAPFASIELVSELDYAGDQDDATLPADQTEVHFASMRRDGPGAPDIYRAVRPDADSPWAAPALVGELSTSAYETGTRISGDGRTIFFGSDRAGGGSGLDLWTSTRPSLGATWSAPSLVSELSSPRDDGAAMLEPDGQGIYFIREAGGADGGIWYARRAGASAPWDTPALVPGLDTPFEETSPFPLADGLTLLFSSNRPGGAGDFDLWVATRPSPGAAFSTALPVEGVNTAEREDDPWLSPDGRTLYFSRSDSSGAQHIFRARR